MSAANSIGRRIDSGEPHWCAACGHFGGLAALEATLLKASREAGNWVFVGGRGCAAKLPRAIPGFRMEIPAGQALAVGAGLALATPRVRVCVVTGDTEASVRALPAMRFAATQPIRLLHLVLDNAIAASSGRIQAASSGPRVSSPAAVAIEAGVPFVASGLAQDMDGASKALEAAMEFGGFAVVSLRSACGTFHHDEDDAFIAGGARVVPPSHRVGDRSAALALAREPGVNWRGVLYKKEGAGKSGA